MTQREDNTDRADRNAFPTGTVSAVRPQSRDANRVSVFMDGKFAFGLPSDAASDLGIGRGTFVDDALALAAARADAAYRARQRALRLLAHRDRSVAEIRDRLARAGFEAPSVEDAVSRLIDLGYLDDESFALAYARGRARNRGYGSRRIAAELRRKGVDERVVREVVQTIEDERDPEEDALAAARRAWARIGSEPDAMKRRNRLYGFLARRGFPPDVIARVFDALEHGQP